MNRGLVESVCFAIAEMAWIITICLLFHNRGYKRGYERGHRVGKEQGYQDGFTAGKIHAETWWMDAELDVDKARQEIRKEEA
jgi:hypothetical protein